MSVILPSSGAPRSIMSKIATVAGKTTADVVVENDSVDITIYVISAEGTRLDIKVQELGDNVLNIRTIHTFDTIIAFSAEPTVITLPVKGRLLFTAEYNGATSFEIHGKGTSASAGTQSIKLVGPDDDIANVLTRDGNKSLSVVDLRAESLLQNIYDQLLLQTALLEQITE